MQAFISIDIGTTNTKGLLVDESGKPHASFAVRHLIKSPVTGWAEHDMEANWWGDAVAVIRGLLLQSGIAPDSVQAVMLSGVCPTLGFTDKNGKPLRNGIIQSDGRVPQKSLEDFGLTPWDHWGPCSYLLPNLIWLTENEPEVIEQARMLFYPHSYLFYRLTGKYWIDFNTPCWYAPLYDKEKRAFDRSAVDAIGLKNCELPQVHAPIEFADAITKEAAETTGLSINTKVLVGTGDFYLSMMAAGVQYPGDATLYFGSTGFVFILNENMKTILERPTQSGMAGDPIQFGPCFPVSGILLEWFCENFARYEADRIIQKEPNIFKFLDSEAEKLPIGADHLLFLPHMNGERNPTQDPAARGVLFGLNLNHNVVSVYRAIMESYCYSVRHAIETMEAEKDIAHIKRWSLSGGGAKSSLWRQMTSDTLNIENRYYPHGDECLAGAYLAMMGCGFYQDFDCFYSQWLGQQCIYTHPSSGNAVQYNKVFHVYKNIYDRLKGSYTDLELF